MCGRGSLTRVESELEERFDATFYSEDLERYNPLPSFNIAPTHWHPVVPMSDKQHFRYFKWGLIPFWAKEASIGSKMINARAETLDEKPSFKTALQKRRCLVPMDGFYEWKKDASGKRHPYRICRKDRDVFFMAGLFDQWKNPEGILIPSFTIITCAANEMMKPLHDRMPVMLLPEEEKLWLEEQWSMDQLHAFLKPFPDEWMEAYPVSERVNNVRNNDSDLVICQNID
ncbi:MAG: SOS response-associated peptidase [Saprospiraceae bacterium]|nr:SOS response-associated peptidase [Saprospiraceae bacterium]